MLARGRQRGLVQRAGIDADFARVLALAIVGRSAASATETPLAS
jgi:hypothetical protein